MAMSLTTLAKSRPWTLHWTTIRRWVSSRLIVLGPVVSITSATWPNVTRLPDGVSMIVD
jgi:hypothetical protein